MPLMQTARLNSRSPSSSATCQIAHKHTCPVTTQIARSRSLTCSEESSLTNHDSMGVRFARFIDGQVAACDNEACPIRSLASVSGRVPDWADARADRRSTANRGKLSGRGCRTRTIQWQEGKFIDRGQYGRVAPSIGPRRAGVRCQISRPVASQSGPFACPCQPSGPKRPSWRVNKPVRPSWQSAPAGPSTQAPERSLAPGKQRSGRIN